MTNYRFSQIDDIRANKVILPVDFRRTYNFDKLVQNQEQTNIILWCHDRVLYIKIVSAEIES